MLRLVDQSHLSRISFAFLNIYSQMDTVVHFIAHRLVEP